MWNSLKSASVPDGVFSQPQLWPKRSTKPLCSTVLSFTAWVYFSIRDDVFILCKKFKEALNISVLQQNKDASSLFL